MIPQNEMGVIVEFSQKAKEAGITILEIQPSYPDAKIERGGREYLVEFEYKSSNFVIHGHDIRKCDLVICWEDDYKNIVLPVIELSKEDWIYTEFVALSPLEKEAFYWKQRALIAEKQLTELSPNAPSRQLARGKVADTRQRIEQILKTNDKLTSEVIAGMVGVSSGRVRQIRQTLAANGKG